MIGVLHLGFIQLSAGVKAKLVVEFRLYCVTAEQRS
jgi:hypothetical protein